MELFHVAVLVLFAAIAIWVTSRACLSLRALRGLELAVFGAAGAFHFVRQYLSMEHEVRHGQNEQLVADVALTALIWYATMAAYAMFIPNTWRRAAAVIIPMAIASMIVPFMMMARYETARELLYPGLMSGLLILTFIGAGTSIYGTHLINALRAQTFEIEERSRAVFNATPEGIIVADAEGTIETFNPAAERLFGYAAHEAVGQNTRIIFPPACWDQRRVLLRDSRDSRARQVLDSAREVTGVRRDGTTFPMELTMVEMRVQDRRMITCIVRDITQRRRAEQALRDSEKRFCAIFDNSFEFMSLLSPDGTVLETNRGRDLEAAGLRIEDIQGRPAWEAPWLAHTPEARENFRRAILEAAQGKFLRHEVTLYDAQGERRTFDTSLTPITDENGRVVSLISEGRDISERKRAEVELKRAKEAAEAASQAKSDFLANMSHELRTPMNGILGMTELTLDTQLAPRQREFLGMVKTSADNLLALLNDILDFSKIEAGKFELENIDFRLRDTVGETLSILALRAHGKGLELACHIRPEVPDALIGDAVRLRQIIVNLVGNALKFTERGEVVVRVSEEASTDDAVYLRFSVTDTGIGIAKDKQQMIFNVFEQADSSTTRKHGGTGLGLAISSELARMMGGRIWVESEVGKGSTFHVTARLGLQKEVDHTPPPELAELEGLRVLVVDDNATNRFILREILTNWHMTPTLADGAEPAFAALEQAQAAATPIALMISDVNMPETDGFALAERLKSDSRFASLPVILLTSADRFGDVERTRALGLAGHLIKPVRHSALLNTILQSFGKRIGEGDDSGPGRTRQGARHRRSLRVLLAEDNEINQTMAINLLEKWGHRVVVANNGREAVAATEDDSFDLVLMDLQMPEMDGMKATTAIRSREANHGNGNHVPIIAMTAHALKGDRERCLAAGMDGYVSKPIQPQDLNREMDSVLPLSLAAASHSNQFPREVFDHAALMKYVDGDHELLDKIIAQFVDTSPKLLAKVRDAIDHNDAPALEFSAHTLKGAVGNFFAGPARAAALRLEEFGASGKLAEARQRLDDLGKEIERLRDALASLGREAVT